MARKGRGEGPLASICSPSPGWSAVHQFWGSLSCPLASWSTAIARCLLQRPGRPLPFPNLAPETGGHIQWSWVVRLGTSQSTPDGLPGSLFGKPKKPNHDWVVVLGKGQGRQKPRVYRGLLGQSPALCWGGFFWVGLVSPVARALGLSLASA